MPARLNGGLKEHTTMFAAVIVSLDHLDNRGTDVCNRQTTGKVQVSGAMLVITKVHRGDIADLV